MNNLLRLPRRGFTLVELLIVIVVIGILAAITLVAYNGVQQQASNAAMKSEVASIAKLLHLYYGEQGTVSTLFPVNTVYCLTTDNSCTDYAGTVVTYNNASVMTKLGAYGNVPQSVAHLDSKVYGVYVQYVPITNSIPFVYNGQKIPLLVGFWLQGKNQDCTGIGGLTSVTGNNPFSNGSLSNGSTGASGTMTRCYEILTGFTS